MDIDITPIDNRTVDVPCFIKFVREELRKHIALVKNRDYKKVAFTTSNKNNFKKFFEELIPLMFFLEREEGIFNKIQYMSGDQPEGDAILDDSVHVEITKAQNINKYLVKQDMLSHGYAFSPKNIQAKTTPSSPTKTQPYVHTDYEHVKDVASYIHSAIGNKLKNNYHNDSILIILFESDTLMIDCDGDYSCLEKEIIHFEKGIFSKICIIENFLNEDLKPRWQFMLQ
jgi:hypothetical protein